MPGHATPDWVSNPTGIVDELFNTSVAAYRNDPQQFRKDIENMFLGKIRQGTQDCRFLVPRLNEYSENELKAKPASGSLVRFRCMIQDEKSAAYHHPFLEVKRMSGEATHFVCLMFRDMIELKDGEQGFLADPRNMKEIRCLKCVSIPGETGWVRQAMRRPGNECGREPAPSISLVANFYAEGGSDLKINEACELYGILSHTENDDDVGHPGEPVVRPLNLHMHVLFFEPLLHSHPALPLAKKELQLLVPSLVEVRSMLKEILASYVCGDALAADYLLLHLISSVHSRADGLAVGNFALNFTNVPSDASFVATFVSCMERIVTKMVHYPLTIAGLNTSRLVPKLNTENADMDQDLLPGVLQLTEQTHLILDEGGMESGTLNDAGVKNTMALQKVVKDQILNVDYFTQIVEFSVDISVIVLSQAKSLIECRYIVPIKPNGPSSRPLEVSEDVLSLIRSYLVACKSGDYEIPTDLRQSIVDEFVERRKADRSISGEYLHNQLDLARYMSLSYGENTLTAERWRRVTELESERLVRL